jgi:hypothetical protein
MTAPETEKTVNVSETKSGDEKADQVKVATKDLHDTKAVGQVTTKADLEAGVEWVSSAHSQKTTKIWSWKD